MLIAINTNIIASETLIKCFRLNNIDNLIALSTYKSIEPCNIYIYIYIYGYSKLIMQKIILDNDYSIYQGLSFFLVR